MTQVNSSAVRVQAKLFDCDGNIRGMFIKSRCPLSSLGTFRVDNPLVRVSAGPCNRAGGCDFRTRGSVCTGAGCDLCFEIGSDNSNIRDITFTINLQGANKQFGICQKCCHQRSRPGHGKDDRDDDDYGDDDDWGDDDDEDDDDDHHRWHDDAYTTTDEGHPFQLATYRGYSNWGSQRCGSYLMGQRVGLRVARVPVTKRGRTTFGDSMLKGTLKSCTVRSQSQNNNGWWGGGRGWGGWWGGCMGAAIVIGVAVHVGRRRRQAVPVAASNATAAQGVQLAHMEPSAPQLNARDIAALYAAADSSPAPEAAPATTNIREIEAAYATVPDSMDAAEHQMAAFEQNSTRETSLVTPSAEPSVSE